MNYQELSVHAEVHGTAEPAALPKVSWGSRNRMSDQYPTRQRAHHAARLRLRGDRAVGMVRGAILPFARLTNPP